MKKKKVWRYYCDFCGKAGCSGGHLKHHEERCTLNPDRTCGMCKLAGELQPNLKTAMDILPDPKEYAKEDEYGFISYDGLEEPVDKILQELRDFVGNCPTCIMAALRQKGIPVPIAKNFKFKSECDDVWAEFNDSQRNTYYVDEIEND